MKSTLNQTTVPSGAIFFFRTSPKTLGIKALRSSVSRTALSLSKLVFIDLK